MAAMLASNIKTCNNHQNESNWLPHSQFVRKTVEIALIGLDDYVGMAELADATDLKSVVYYRRAGSTPATDIVRWCCELSYNNLFKNYYFLELYFPEFLQ